MPTLATIVFSSSGRTVARTIDSIPLTIRSVSSIRVPIGALTLIRNCASSDGGKNSVPMSGLNPKWGAKTRKRLATKVAAIPPTTMRRWPSAHTMTCWYTSDPLEEAPGEPEDAIAERSGGRVDRLLRLEDLQREEGGDGPGHQEGGEERDRDRERERDEEELDLALEEHGGHEDDDRRDRRREDRHGHLAGGVQHRPPALRARHRQVPVDVLQLDDRVVHEPADRQGEAAQREDVERLTQEVHDDEREQDREGDGDRDDEGRGERAQEDQDDEEGEGRALEGLVPEALDGLADVGRLVEGDPDVHAGRNADDLRDERPHLVHHCDGVRARLLVDAHEDATRTVDPHDGRLRLVRVDDVPEVLDMDRHAAGARLADDDVLHRPDEPELVVGVDVVVEPAHFDVACRQQEVRVVDGADDVEHREALGEELVAVQVDRDLPYFAAVHRGRGHAAQALELGLDRVVGEVIQLLLVEPAARRGDEAHRDVREVEPKDEGLLDPRGR